MKRNLLFFALGVMSLGIMSTSMTRINPNNPPMGNTGAPGETTCQKSGCHSGGSYTGTPVLSGLPDTVEAGVLYNVTLTLTSDCVKSGFEMTALDGSNIKTGTFASGTGSSVGIFAGKQYVRQSSPHSLAGGTTSWTFKWTAPATAADNTITFYYSMLNANGNGHDTGDNVSHSQTTVMLKQQIILGVENTDNAITISPNPVSDFVTVHQSADHAQFLIVDMQGNIVFEQTLNSGSTSFDLSGLPKGIYAAVISNTEGRIGRKIVLQ